MALPEARNLAKRALSVDAALPEAHALMGVVAALYDYDWKEAGRRFKLAMASPPVTPEVRGFHAYFYLGLIGRYNEAIAALREVLTEDPLNLLMRESLAECLLASGRHEEAEAECRWLLEVDDNFWLAYFVLSISQFARGLATPAVEMAEKCYSCVPVPAAAGLLAGLLEKTGDHTRAAGLLNGLGDGAAYGAPAGFSIYHLVLGDKAQAEEWILRASDQHHPDAVFHPSYYFRFFECGPPSPALMARFRLQGAAL
jgi:tetratricopeptide (TPR) repeat protein